MRALTFSSSINAYTLQVASRELGIDLQTTDAPPTFPMPNDSDLATHDFLAFTEESSLRRALDGQLSGRFLPSAFPTELLDDKWAFAEWLRVHEHLTPGVNHWPMTYEGALDFPCYVKARHSWRGGRKLPRGWLCDSGEHLQRLREEITNQGLQHEHFFIQEWLGSDECRVLSVCGFHDCKDSTRNLSCLTERIASYSDGPSSSAAVATRQDEWGLTERAEAILDALSFEGPYELEFLLAGDRLAALELNPRFWMQHALFLADGNGLAKRYYGVETENDRKQKTIRNLIWVDGLHVVACLPRLQFRTLREVRAERRKGDYEVLIWPSVPLAAWVWLRLIWKKLRKVAGIGQRSAGPPELAEPVADSTDGSVRPPSVHAGEPAETVRDGTPG